MDQFIVVKWWHFGLWTGRLAPTGFRFFLLVQTSPRPKTTGEKSLWHCSLWWTDGLYVLKYTGPKLAGWCKTHAMEDLAMPRSAWSVVKSNHSHNPAPGIIVWQKCQAGYCVAKHLLQCERPTSCHPGWAISRFLVSLQRKSPQLSNRPPLLPNLPA